MDAMDLVIPLLTELELRDVFEIPTETANAEVNVWHLPPRDEKNLAIVNAGAFASRLEATGTSFMVFGDMYSPEEPLMRSITPVLLIGETEPKVNGAILDSMPFLSFLLACKRRNAGIGVESNGSYVFATATFTDPLLEAASKTLYDSAKRRFYTEAKGSRMYGQLADITQQLINDEVFALLSIDTGRVSFGDEDVSVICMNFREDADVTADDVERIKTEMKQILNPVLTNYVLFSKYGETDLAGTQVTRIAPMSFDADFERIFGPQN